MLWARCEDGMQSGDFTQSLLGSCLSLGLHEDQYAGALPRQLVVNTREVMA